MGMNNKFRDSRRTYLLFVSLLIVVLVSSLFVCTFVNGDSGASLENAVHVKNEDELRNAVKNASNGKPTTIALDNDITLTETLRIKSNKDIILLSNRADGFWKLLGADRFVTIYVENSGRLTLDGVIVTHVNGSDEIGVFVAAHAYLFMYSGEISDNTASQIETYNHNGAGVRNLGTFMMYGGKISGNTAMLGGGVYNYGNFSMFGGEISGNNAVMGGGVFNLWNFSMFGGKIVDNTADYGGGVHYWGGVFDRSGGVISGNTASYEGNNIFEGSVSGSADSDNGNAGDDSGLFDGNTNETPDSDGDSSTDGNGSSIDDNGLFVGGFSLRDVVFVCVGVAIVVVTVVGVVVLLLIKRKN